VALHGTKPLNDLNEAPLRLALFIAIFAAIAVWEWRRPRRQPQVRGSRWGVHVTLAGLNSLVVRLIAPASGVSFAPSAEQAGWGLFQGDGGATLGRASPRSFALDLVVYLQHRLFHAVPWFWRMHRVHHADVQFDVTTGVRFHPLEIAVSTLIKGAAILALGASAAAVRLFEIFLNAGSLFSHANGSLPPGVDRVVRRVLVTPDMHRVHHSVVVEEQNTDFGFNVSWWDRVFGTYRPAPAQPHESMPNGVLDWRGPETDRILPLLSDPSLRTEAARPAEAGSHRIIRFVICDRAIYSWLHLS
jgi:sterol desaturase/sphingolipid hydroxylase (fatty acid hydroxylase superfamily)